MAVNILHIMEDYKPTAGGSVVRNGNMIEAYHERFPEDEIYLVNLEGKLYERESDDAGVHIYRAKSLKEQIDIAREIVKKRKIDIIHAHNFRFLFAGFAAKGFRNIKMVSEIHALYRMSVLKELISYFLLRRTNQIIVLADSAKKYLMEHKRVKQERIAVVRNGLEKAGESKSELPVNGELYKTIQGIKEDGYTIASYNGSFIDWQGVRLLAEQMDYLPGIHEKLFLLMVGDGEEYGYVADKVSHCRYKERVLVHAGIPKNEMRRLYELIDIILIPRIKSLKTDTAVPLKAIEAMQCSKCILASGDDGIKEILNPENAMIYEPGNATDFEGKLKVLVSDKDLREKLGRQAGRDADSLLVSWKENSERVNALYKKE